MQQHRMAAAAPRFSVVVPARDEELHLACLLESLKAQRYPAELVEVIVVDNGSLDRTIEVANRFGVTVVSAPGVHVGAVRNRGADVARGEYLAFVDADCTVEPDFLSTAEAELTKSQALLLGGLVKQMATSLVSEVWCGTLRRRSVEEIAPGAGMLISRELFFRLGGFSEGLTSGEDTEFAIRAVRNGVEMRVAPSLPVAHYGCPAGLIGFIRRSYWTGAGAATMMVTRRNRGYWAILSSAGAVGTMLAGAMVMAFGGSATVLLIGTAMFLCLVGLGVQTRDTRHLRCWQSAFLGLLFALSLVSRVAGLVTMIVRPKVFPRWR